VGTGSNSAGPGASGATVGTGSNSAGPGASGATVGTGSNSAGQTTGAGSTDPWDASAWQDASFSTSQCPGPGVAPAPATAACGAALCGNGVRDTCVGAPPGAFEEGPPDAAEAGAPFYLTEACDGQDLNGASCASLGYRGGTLKCGVSCDFDTRGCDLCQAGGKIERCLRPNLDDVGSSLLALGAADSEIVLAWVSGATASGGSGVHLARFSPDLSLLAETGCLGLNDAWRLSLSIAPSGWILAVDTARGIELRPLSPTLVARKLEGGPILGGPLLVWSTGPSTLDNTRWATLLADDARTETPDVMLARATAEEASAVFVGDGFLYADLERGGVAIERIGLDGVLGARQAPVPDAEYPQLSWTGSGGRLVYQTLGSRMMWAPLDSSGALLAPSVTIGPGAFHFQVVAVGDDALVLTTLGNSGLEITHLSKAGTIVDGPYSLVANAPSIFGWDRVIAGRGSDAIVAWATGGDISGPADIGLARVTP
jgi:hypothetical protein